MTTPRPVTDALDVTCPDHWHCDPALAPHACDRPNRTRQCPTCGEAPRPVTGPDGDNPITDEQIRDLQRSTTDRELIAISSSALNPLCNKPRWTEARTHCAAAYNARAGRSSR